MNHIHEDLHRIHSQWRRALVSVLLSAFVLAGRTQAMLQRARPIHLLFPSAFAQALLAFFVTRFEAARGLFIFAAGTLTIVGLAMLPSTMRRKYHWVQ